MRLQRKYGRVGDHTPKRSMTTSDEYCPASYSDPIIRRGQDPLVSHLTHQLAEKEAETAALKEELEKEKFSHNRLKDIKVPYYSGNTDFEEYLSQFIGICEYQRWTDDEAAIMLLAKLTGDALSVAAALDDQSLRSLIMNLRRNFSQEQEEVATLKLSSRKQKSDESYESLSFDIQRLTKKAYSGTDDTTRDRIARDAFLNAITDDSVREKLRDLNPKTLAEAVRESRRLAANKDLEKGRAKGTLRQTAVDQTEIQKLQEQIQSLKTSQKSRRGGSNEQQGRGTEGQWRSRNPGYPPTCWRCFMKGHLARWCPFTDEEIAKMKKEGRIPAQIGQKTPESEQGNQGQ